MYKRILVPLDGSKLAECVLSHVEEFVAAARVEQLFFVRVTEPVAVHFEESMVYSNPEDIENISEKAEKLEQENKRTAEKYLDEVVGRFESSGVDCTSAVLVGEPADKIIEYVDEKKIDLVIIATHGRSGISRWVRGSIADRVLHSARAPILMVRAELCSIKDRA